MPKVSKAYLIDAVARQIVDIDLADLKDYRKYLPGGLCIGAVYPSGDVLYVDDEGMLRPAVAAFRIKSRRDGQPMMSNGIMTGRDGPTDGTLPPWMSKEQLLETIEWLDREQALDWLRAQADKPSMTSISTDGSGEVLQTWSELLRAQTAKD